MARKKASKTSPKPSWAHSFWDFVETNPKLAAAIAFQLGVMAAEAVSTPTARSLRKRVKKMPQQIADAIPRNLPDSLTAAALKYLPGSAPKLQPRKHPVGKAHRGRHPKVSAAIP